MPYYTAGYIGEIIVVDGASTDGTLDIIKNYPIKLMTDPGKGMFVGYEAAWRTAGGELVMFIDSDAYLSKGFFPGLYEQFDDASVGIVGCLAKADAQNDLGKSIGQWWDYHGASLQTTRDKPPSWLKRVYNHVVSFSGDGQANVSGPCYAVRRACLDKVNGFADWLYLYDLIPRLQYPGDIYLSDKITKAGWHARWWVGAPAYHHPPAGLREMVKQRFAWGKGDGILLRLAQKGCLKRMAPPLIRLGGPVFGLWLAVHYRNPHQLIFLPLAQYAWIAGYIKSLTFDLTKCRPK